MVAAQLLRAAPGEWRTVHVYASRYTAAAVANRVRRPDQKLFAYRPEGAFEARVEPVSEGTALLARFVGGVV